MPEVKSNVVWLYGAICFLLWMGYGVLQARRSAQIRAKVGTLSRLTRGLGGAALIVLSLALLMAALLGVQALGGIGSASGTWWGWLAVALLGLGFVHAQTMAMAMLVSLALEPVTRPPSRTSTSERPQ